jgi:hypothetical protein
VPDDEADQQADRSGSDERDHDDSRHVGRPGTHGSTRLTRSIVTERPPDDLTRVGGADAGTERAVNSHESTVDGQQRGGRSVRRAEFGEDVADVDPDRAR